jgi:heavy metal sensor kinase
MSILRGLFSRLDLLFHSIRFRLILWFVLILSLVLAVFSALLLYSRVRELRAETVNRLEAKYEGVEHFIRSGALAVTDPEALRAGNGEGALLGPNDVFALLNSDGSPAYISGPLAQPPLLDLSRVEVDPHEHAVEYKTYIRARNIDLYAFLVTPVLSSNRLLAGFIVIGTPIDPAGVLMDQLVALLGRSGLMLLLAFGGGFLLADRAMRPVKTIASQARSIGETDLSRRFNLGRKDEIGQLADTFDSMLARLEAAFARQRQFTADASHELRTPLTIVNLEASRALAAPRSSAEYQRALEVILSENEMMSRLVNDLLTLARLDAGREPLQKEPLDLSDLALEVVERLEPLASRLGVHLLAGDLPEARVLGDRQALLRLLSNLIENAIKYTAGSASGAKKRVQVQTGVSEDLSEAWVRVADTGPGIPSEHLSHLFDRFYRADESRSRSHADLDSDPFPTSSGLGLAIAQGIAGLHGGRIDVQSREGEGSLFELSLPMLQDSPQD